MLSDLNQEIVGTGNTLSQALITPYTTYVCATVCVQYSMYHVGGYTYLQ